MTFNSETFEVKVIDNKYHFSFTDELSEGLRVYTVWAFGVDDIEPQSIAETLYDTLITVLQNSHGKTVYDKLEDSLRAINAEMRRLRGHVKKLPDALIAVFDYHEIHITEAGFGEAYLIRDRQMTQISETYEASEELFQNILSGEIRVNDSLILSTVRLLRHLSKREIIDIFSSHTADSTHNLKQSISLAADEDMLLTIINIGKTEKNTPVFTRKITTPIHNNTTYTDDKSDTNSVNNDVYDDVDTHNSAYNKPYTHPARVITKSRYDDFKRRISAIPLGEVHTRVMNTLSNIPKSMRRSDRNIWMYLLLGLGIVILAIVVRMFLLSNNNDTAELRTQKDIGYEALNQAGRYLLEGKRDEANQYLLKAETAAKTILSSKSDTYRYDATKIIDEVKEKRLSVENAEQGVQRVMADISLKSDKFKGNGIVELREQLFAYSENEIFKVIRNVVDRVDGDIADDKILAGTTRDGQNTVVFLTSTPRVLEYKDGAITRMDTADSAWKRGIDIKAYADKYVYILDPVENQIWKYERLRSRYSGATAYNLSSNDADLSQSVSMAIDGSVWIITSEGKLLKFMRGEIQNYSFIEMPSIELKGTDLKIFTTQNHDLLYVLDPTNQRILLFNKDEKGAKYKRQVLFNIPDATDFYINEAGLRAYILSANKVYEVEL